MFASALACLLSAPAATATISVAIIDTNVSCVLAGGKKGALQSGEKIATLVKPGTKFQLFDAAGPRGETTSSPLQEGAPPCDETPLLEFTKLPQGGTFVGVKAPWPAQPRKVQALPTNSAVYQKVVGDLLKSKKVNAAPSIDQVLKVDLDGDGTDEVLISANHHAAFASSDAINDYALLLLRRIKGKAVEDLVLDFEKQPRDGGVSKLWIAALIDADGDGRFEIVTSGSYGGGVFTQLRRIKAGKAEIISSCACGD